MTLHPTLRPTPRPIPRLQAAAFRRLPVPLLAAVLLAPPAAQAVTIVVDDFNSAGTVIPVSSGLPNQAYGTSATWDAGDLAFDCCRFAAIRTAYANAGVWGATREAAVNGVLRQGSVSTGALDLDAGAGALVASLTNGSADSAGNWNQGWSFLTLSYRPPTVPVSDVGKNAVLRISFDSVYTSAASGQFQIDLDGLRTTSGASAGTVSTLVANSGGSTTATLRLGDNTALQSLFFRFWSAGVQAGQTVASQVLRITSIALDMTVVRALTTLAGATASDDVTLTADELLAAPVRVNSLTVNNARVHASNPATRITVVGDDTDGARLTTSGQVTLAPVLAFDNRIGRVAVDGNTVLAGGVVATQGITVSGQGRLDLGAAGTVAGNLSTGAGITLLLSADDAARGAAIRLGAGAVLDIGNTTQHVQALTGPLNTRGDPVGWAVLRGAGTLVADDQVWLKQDVLDANLSARTVRLYSPGSTLTVNGNLHTALGADIGAWDGAGRVTFNGVVSGAGAVNGYSGGGGSPTDIFFTNRNNYTGPTWAGSVNLSGRASIAGSSDVNAPRVIVSAGLGDDPALDRLGDRARITLLGSGNDPAQASLLRVQAAAGLNLVEDIGTLSLFGGRGQVDLASGAGSVALRADGLDLRGNQLDVDLGSNGRLALDTAPALYAGSNLIRDVWVTRRVNGGSMPTWAIFNADGLGSVADTPLAAARIADAGTQSFVRLTSETNAALDTDRSIAGLGIDTTQALAGSGTLTLGSGQLMLWQDNTITLTGLRGLNGLTVSNAGTNTIGSAILNTPRLTKLGSGTLVLAGRIDLDQVTVAAGRLVLGDGSAFSLFQPRFEVLGGGTLAFAGTQQHVVNSSFSGTGAVVVEAGARLAIQGASGLFDLQLTNLGTLTNGSAATVGSNQGHIDNAGYLQVIENTGTVQNTSTGTLLLNGLANAGSIVNAGRAQLDGIYTATSTDALASYRQTDGSTVINGDFHGDIQLDAGMLGGSGHIHGHVLAASGAVVAPGNSPGTLTIDGLLHMASGAVLTLQLDQTGIDQVVAGSFLFDAGATIAFDFGSSGYSADDFLPGSDGAPARFSLAGLFRLTDGSAPDFASFAPATLAGLTTRDGLALTHVTAAGTVSAVPEPAPLALLLAGLGVVAWRARGRHGRAQQRA